jgi:hypothetical protein
MNALIFINKYSKDIGVPRQKSEEAKSFHFFVPAPSVIVQTLS